MAVEDYSKNYAMMQPIPPKLETVLNPNERIICAFKGDWLDYGIGGKTRIGMWVITDQFVHFMGKVSL
ncbi:MAG: hypothetical protein JSV49_01310, partial [Thermoplasmata archaeon]